jgi:phosphomannomutase
MIDSVCQAYTRAFLTVVTRTFTFQRVALGIDLRPSSPEIARACVSAIQAAGLEVVFCGALPTPALALYAQQMSIPAIMVTGSHIPFDRNGLKFYRHDGEISKVDEAAMRELPVDAFASNIADTLPLVNTQALQIYTQRYLDFFPRHSLAGLRLGLYEHSSVARDVLRTVLKQLGAEVISLGRTETFVPIDTEAVSAQDAQQGRAWSADYGFDSILSTDGDGDRPLISDEQGNWVRGDIVGLLCARYLGVKQLAVPVSCNTGIELSGAFNQVLCTRIGSPYVIAAMQSFNDATTGIAGFEANGGFLLGSAIQREGKSLAALATRDAVLPALAVLVAAQEKGVPISALLHDLPKRYTASDRLQNCPTAITQCLLSEWAQDMHLFKTLLNYDVGDPIGQDLTDGLRIMFDNGEIIHLRASGNAPELRCYCEAATPARAEALTNSVLTRMVGLMNEASL